MQAITYMPIHQTEFPPNHVHDIWHILMFTCYIHIQASEVPDLASDNFGKNLIEDMIASNMPG